MLSKAFARCSGSFGCRRAHAAFSQALQDTSKSQPPPFLGVPTKKQVQVHVPSSELVEIRDMKSSDLRKWSQAASAEGAHPELWNAIAERCETFAEQMKYWDIVHVLQAFTSARVEHPQLYLCMAEALCSKTSKFAPKQIWDLFAIYEAIDLRPRALYVELFHATIRLCRSMYAEEIALTLQTLARHKLGNPTVVAHLVSAVMRQLNDFRLRYICGVVGALGSLEMVPDKVLENFDGQAKLEVQSVALQELLENLQAFPELEFSWRPYEDLCLEEFKSRVSSFTTASDVGALADPFEAMHFLRARELLEDSFLEALCQWCLLAVHQPNVRSERRPTSKQLFQLYDRCWEANLECAPALQDAIAYYVESGGGQWPQALPKPLRYNRGSRYFRSADPLEDIVTSPSASDAARRQGQRPLMEDLPGLPPSNPSYAGDVYSLSDGDTTGIEEPSAPQRRRKKCGGETVGAWITSRKSVRPRHRRDPGLKRILRKNWHRAPLFLYPGYASRPKYRPGVATRRYPWADVIVGPRGGAWAARR